MTIHARLPGVPYGPLQRKDAGEPDLSNLPDNVKKILSEFAAGFKTYKEKNDAALAEVKKTGTQDVVRKEELKKIDDQLDSWQKKLDELTLEIKRPILTDAGEVMDGSVKRKLTAEEIEHKADFEKYFRKGDVSKAMLAREEKALSAGSNPDGGYTVPITIDQNIGRILSQAGNFRAVAQVMNISTGQYQKPFTTSGAGAGWVGETQARPETASPTLARLSFIAHEMYANPAATQTLLDDSAVNIEQWLADEVRIKFSEMEEQAFISGDGVGKPSGILSYPTVADASWTWGKLGYIFTGSSGALDANEADDLIDLVYSLKAGYRANARFMLNRLSLAALRKIKDTTDNYIWQPGMGLGQPSSILGYPVTEAEEMPNIAADSFSVAFGDFRAGYLIVDRIGIRVLRDPYTNKPYVMFYTTKRVGGGVQNFEAIKLLKFGTS